MKKILVVMGSPHKGESYQALQQVEALLQDMGEVTFDMLWLKDANYSPCRGCHACIKLGEQKCPLKDDMASVEARMMAADGMILITPVYSNQVSYLMKTFIDRYSYMWHRPRLFGKFVMGIAVGGGQFGSTLGYLKECTGAWGCTWVTGLGVAHPGALTPKYRANLDKDMQKAAGKFFSALQAGRAPAASLNRLIWFRMWRINAQACQEDNPTDFRYWTDKGWFGQDYYTGERIQPVKRLVAMAIEPLILSVMRRVYVGY